MGAEQATDDNVLTLDKLAVGDTASVISVAATEPAEGLDLTRRLKELGFVQGEAIEVLHRGYFGGEPIAVRVGHSTFALRNFEAALISTRLV
jgi:ferrous iron transport protein A